MATLEPNWIDWPHARIRRRLTVQHGVVERFTLQFEYNAKPAYIRQEQWDWRPVARFDHNSSPYDGHDIRDEGLHMDIYKDGERHRVLTGFPSVPLAEAPRFCERFLEKHALRYLARYEQENDIRPRQFFSE